MRLLPLLLIALGLAGCARSDLPPVQAVGALDLQRYSGRWYEIARYDHIFERGMVAVTADYTPLPDGRVGVVNAGRRGGLDGTEARAEAVAWLPDPAEPAKLRVRFFWPFWGSYWVLALDPGYRWAVVGHPSRDYLWFLARTPALAPGDRAAMEAAARAQGFDLARLVEVAQPGR